MIPTSRRREVNLDSDNVDSNLPGSHVFPEQYEDDAKISSFLVSFGVEIDTNGNQRCESFELH